MKNQDRGLGIKDKVQDAGSGEGRLLSPQSSVLRSKQQAQSATMFLGEDPCGLDPAVLQRMRWRCRRGLLELDIVLGRFVERYYNRLSEKERQIFEEFLDMPDNPLWDMIAGRQDAVSEEQAALLEKINAA
jgi:antitoxin CptB